MDGSDFDLGWIASPLDGLVGGSLVACWLTAMSVLVAVISLMIEIRSKSLVNLKEIFALSELSCVLVTNENMGLCLYIHKW